MAETSADTCHSLLLLGLHILIGSVLDPCPQKGTLSSHTYTHTQVTALWCTAMRTVLPVPWEVRPSCVWSVGWGRGAKVKEHVLK